MSIRRILVQCLHSHFIGRQNRVHLFKIGICLPKERCQVVRLQISNIISDTIKTGPDGRYHFFDISRPRRYLKSKWKNCMNCIHNRRIRFTRPNAIAARTKIINFIFQIKIKILRYHNTKSLPKLERSFHLSADFVSQLPTLSVTAQCLSHVILW